MEEGTYTRSRTTDQSRTARDLQGGAKNKPHDPALARAFAETSQSFCFPPTLLAAGAWPCTAVGLVADLLCSHSAPAPE